MKTLLRRRLQEEEEEEEAEEEIHREDLDPEFERSPDPTTTITTFRQHVCRACGRTTSVKVVTPLPGASPSNANKAQRTNEINTIVLCDACKKFYCRYRTKIQEETCVCSGGNKSATGDKCRLCRYQRCESAVAERRALAAPKPPPVEERSPEPMEKIDFTKLPCAVCGFSSSGFHFGVVSCEGCKGFFRRSMNKTYKIQYTCKGIRDMSSNDISKDGKTLCPSSSNCRKCRLQRCFDAGMSLKEIAIGRHTVRRRAEIDAAIKRHYAQGSFLTAKLCRRRRTTNGDAGIDDDEEGEDMATTAMASPTSTRDPPISPETRMDNDDSQSQMADTTTVSPDSRTLCPFRSKGESFTPVGFSPNGFEESSPNQFNIMKNAAAFATPSPNSSTALVAVHSSNVVYRFSEQDNRVLDETIGESSEWLIERAVDASVRLAGISAVRIVLDYSMTLHQMVSERVRSLDTYVKCISEFITVLPGINQISMSDRILLFTQGFFPITSAQLSLNFDVEQQIPNHLSLDREGPAWEIWSKEIPIGHMAIEHFLIEAGNRLVTAVGNLQEFSLFCALILLNPDTPNLENASAVRSVRRRYELALFHYFSKTSGVRSEQRLGEIYQLFPFFRRSTSLFHDFFADIGLNRPNDRVVWTPLFKQFHAQIVSLPGAFSDEAVLK